MAILTDASGNTLVDEFDVALTDELPAANSFVPSHYDLVLSRFAPTVTLRSNWYLSDYLIDYGLQQLADYADEVYICDDKPTTYVEATATFALGMYDFGAPGAAFGAIASGTPNGRKVQFAGCIGTVLSAGFATYIGVVDSANSRFLLAAPITTPDNVSVGVPFQIPAFELTIPNSDAG